MMTLNRPQTILAAVLSALTIFALAGCNGGTTNSTTKTTDRSAEHKAAEPKATEPKAAEPKAAEPEAPKPTPQPVTPSKENAVLVKLTTTMGDIVLELDDEKAPISTENFLAYVDAGSFDGTIFHRVIPGFMIQGGGFEPDLSQRPTRATIKNEWKNGRSNEKYTVAMARLGNEPDSASSQFFINLADNGFLDQPRDGAGYAVFGEVVSGQNIVDEIGAVQTTSKSRYDDVPVEPVIITKAERVDN